ncbi:hypothetical protein DPF_2657 [Desulfoplanes formicivorans]|uniref:Uncharacterized protein n=1 Tax=Desulfoplanes formicivorans TaxID=1592317 RepID=A0A194ALL9_9BACT|nr:hypothetical protein DPF_2657 [Desulfoplanes formicivorans]
MDCSPLSIATCVSQLTLGHYGGWISNTQKTESSLVDRNHTLPAHSDQLHAHAGYYPTGEEPPGYI